MIKLLIQYLIIIINVILPLHINLPSEPTYSHILSYPQLIDIQGTPISSNY